MLRLARRIVVVTSLATIAGRTGVSAQAPKPVPGRPYQFWDVLEADGGARKIYFRNDGTVPITITGLVILTCDNIQQTCGTYPQNVVVAPGKTVVAFKAERLDRSRSWNFSYSFHTHVDGAPPTASGQQLIMVMHGPDGSSTVVQPVAIDSLVPAVAAWTEGAACGRITVPDLPAGHRALMMIFGTTGRPTTRRVIVRLDANGSAYDYTDSRSDPDVTSADPRQTNISLDLVRQTVLLRNSGGGQPVAFFRAAGPTLLTAASLDRPEEMIARIIKECGA